MLKSLFVCIAIIAASQTLSSNAQDSFNYDKNIWPKPLKMPGTIVLNGKNSIHPDTLKLFSEANSESDDSIVIISLDSNASPFVEQLSQSVETNRIVNFTYDDLSKRHEEVNKRIANASSISIVGCDAHLSLPSLERINNDLIKHLKKDRVVLFGGSATRLAGAALAVENDNEFNQAKGMNLVPGTVISLSSEDKSDDGLLAMNPRLVGIQIPDETAAILRGRKFWVEGKGEVEFRLMANERKPLRVQNVPAIPDSRVNPYVHVIDLTAWRRDAIDRTLPMFPSATPPKPHVDNGTLVIVGGGGMPTGLFDQFIELAGGKDAKLVYVPCTEAESVSPNNRLVQSWKGKVQSATLFHTKDREKADSDEEFLAPLKDATGIWFGGGRQWNFVDSYYGTKAHKLMLEVLGRGGVIGGSSAGASIQGDYLARANPVANFDIMAPGYERGLGFLEGVAIDQHFSQRGRQKDMTSLANTYPQLLGIGLDERTAIVVQKSNATIVGSGRVFFYDRNEPVIPGKPDYTALTDGQVFDLEERKVVSDGSSPEDTEHSED